MSHASGGDDRTAARVLANAVTEHNLIHVYSIETGELAFRFARAHGDAKITAMCFDASMRRLVTGADDGTVHM